MPHRRQRKDSEVLMMLDTPKQRSVESCRKAFKYSLPQSRQFGSKQSIILFLFFILDKPVLLLYFFLQLTLANTGFLPQEVEHLLQILSMSFCSLSTGATVLLTAIHRFRYSRCIELSKVVDRIGSNCFVLRSSLGAGAR